MKASQLVEVIVINVVLILVLVWVSGEQAARVAYAAQKGLSFTFSRSLFTYFTALGGSNSGLISPPTLDWSQVLALAIVLTDAYYLYALSRKNVAKT